MSKYIIELNDDVQIVQKVGVTNNGNAFSIGIYKDILEQYTPVDVEKIYDKAYRDGYNKGIKDGRVVNKRFVKIDDFNEDLIEELIKFIPYAWFGGAITDYQNEHIPKFVQQLKEEMPLLYGMWAKKYPDTASKYKDVSPVGRTAYISTMPDGEICGWVKRGNTLTNDNYTDTFFFKGAFRSKQPLKVSVEITDDMVAEVTKSMVVDENTKFVD